MKRSYEHEILPSMKCSFQGHTGLYWPDDNVLFYGIRFDKPSEAMKVLAQIKPSKHYRPWCYGRYRGINDTETGKIFVQERWFDTEKLAELYLKNVAVKVLYKN